VARIADQVLEAASHCKAGAILTDAGSNQTGDRPHVEAKLMPNSRFVAASPGRLGEKRVEPCGRRIIRQSLYVLTPTASTPGAGARTVTAFGKR